MTTRQKTAEKDVEINDIVRHDVGYRHERIVKVEYFAEKDGKETFGGPVLWSTEDEYKPSEGWGYVETVTEIRGKFDPPVDV